jgi:hypothetical protein
MKFSSPKLLPALGQQRRTERTPNKLLYSSPLPKLSTLLSPLPILPFTTGLPSPLPLTSSNGDPTMFGMGFKELPELGSGAAAMIEQKARRVRICLLSIVGEELYRRARSELERESWGKT